MNICIPIVAETLEAAAKDIRAAEALSDFVELRIDYLRHIDKKMLQRLVRGAKKKLIVTCRPKEHGGLYIGDEEKRIMLLAAAAESGAAFIDVEKGTRRAEALIARYNVILSYHNFKATPNLLPIYREMACLRPQVIKIVTHANTSGDNLSMLNLIDAACRENVKLIAFCMGEKGVLSRVVSPMLGGFMTYASLKKGRESAPGQIEIRELLNIYRLMRWE